MLLKKLKLILFILKIDKKTYSRVYLHVEECNLKDYNWEEMLLEKVIDAFQYQDMIEKCDKIKKIRKKLF